MPTTAGKQCNGQALDHQPMKICSRGRRPRPGHSALEVERWALSVLRFRTSSFSRRPSSFSALRPAHGRGTGVDLGLGVILGRADGVGLGVAVGVEMGVTVGVGVDVGAPVAVAVGVGVGCDAPPILWRSTIAL